MRLVVDAAGKPHLLLNPAAVLTARLSSASPRVRAAAAAWLGARDAALARGADDEAAAIEAAAAWDAARQHYGASD